MRKLIPVVVLALAAGGAAAQESKASQAGQATKAEGQKKELTAIVVATDPMLKTITVKYEGTPESRPETLPVEGAAVSYLSSIKTGEKVKLVLMIDSATKKQRVTSIEKSSPPA